jgi:hypothetical protein
MTARTFRLILVFGSFGIGTARGGDDRAAAPLHEGVLPLFKARCVKCHGPAKREGKLSLATPRGLGRGGKHGPVVTPGQPDASLIWERIDAEEMPPEEPLDDREKAIVRRWIEAGAPGLPRVDPQSSEKADHWAFAPLTAPELPAVADTGRVRTPIDRFVLARLEARGMTFSPPAAPATLARRLAFDLTGLPPTPEELERFQRAATRDPQAAIEELVDRYLTSPHYGERWGKYWLDAAGYADSNGYFAADTDRPLAFRYRDYVVRSFNLDKPFNRFIVEQLAGDELAGFKAGGTVDRETLDLLVATHYLRNGPDGTGETDGNPDEVRADRYAVLEATTQIMGTSLFGLTLQCARCHDHKFEPVSQRDYYALYAILQSAFDIDNWVKPQARLVEAPAPEEKGAWEAEGKPLEARLASARAELAAWIKQNRPRGQLVFADDFDSAEPLAARWSGTAPGDDGPGGTPPVQVDSDRSSGALVVDRALRIVGSGGAGVRWFATRRVIDWTPDEKDGWVQVTFDLVADRIPPNKAAERIGYFIALHNFQDNGTVTGGNILLDGNPGGGAAVHVDYPGTDTKDRGVIGRAPYKPGGNYGVRVTNIGGGKYRLEHLVEWAVEKESVTLDTRDLPDGGFGFEYCCGRSFVVDNVAIEAANRASEVARAYTEGLAARRKPFDAALQAIKAHQERRPGRIAWVSDVSPDVKTCLLKRGLYNAPDAVVEPAPPAVLCDPEIPFEVRPVGDGAPHSGRRLAFARWLTRPGSRQAALLARVTVNRLWQDHFGTGLTPTSENLGYSGAPPSNPELLEFLASELVRNGWRIKPIHRMVLLSSTFQQASAPRLEAARIDPDDRDLWRFPLRRLDAEAMRDAVLAASGELDHRMGGPYVASRRNGEGEIVVDEKSEGKRRRSIYLQQRRTQVVSLLDTFDAPSLVGGCARRTPTTVPTQALSMLNSEFMTARAKALARRLRSEAGNDPDARLDRAFLLALARRPTDQERRVVRDFLESQPDRYPGQPDAAERSWADFCQMLLSSNAFLYIE